MRVQTPEQAGAAADEDTVVLEPHTVDQSAVTGAVRPPEIFCCPGWLDFNDGNLVNVLCCAHIQTLW